MSALGLGYHSNCKDFSTNKYFSQSYYQLLFNNNNQDYWIIFVENVPSIQDEYSMLSLPNQEYIFNYQQRNIIAVKNTNEKYIKIKSSVPQFYWTLEFSLENDVKYLPDYLTCSSKFENSDTLYSLNPYFSEKKITDYYWFIILFQHNQGSTVTITYEYTNEGKPVHVPEPSDDTSDDTSDYT